MARSGSPSSSANNTWSSKILFLKNSRVCHHHQWVREKQDNFEVFAQEWNQSANGEDRFYVTAEVLLYSKTWEKSTNIWALQELILDQLEVAQQTANVFAAEVHPFPTYLTGIPTSTHPCEGVVDFKSSENLQTSATPVPDSLSIDLALSQPQLPSPDSMINPIFLALLKPRRGSPLQHPSQCLHLPVNDHQPWHMCLQFQILRCSANYFVSQHEWAANETATCCSR